MKKLKSTDITVRKFQQIYSAINDMALPEFERAKLLVSIAFNIPGSEIDMMSDSEFEGLLNEWTNFFSQTIEAPAIIKTKNQRYKISYSLNDLSIEQRGRMDQLEKFTPDYWPEGLACFAIPINWLGNPIRKKFEEVEKDMLDCPLVQAMAACKHITLLHRKMQILN